MKKLIVSLLVLTPIMLFAGESYWKIERVKPLMKTGLFFEVALDQFSNLDHILYDEDKKALWYYDTYSSKMPERPLGNSLLQEEGEPSKERHIEARIVGGELKILVYHNSRNIAFIVCKRVADDKTAFLEKVDASRKKLQEYIADAVKKHPPVTMPAAADNTSQVKVKLEGLALALPADRYLVVKTQTGSYEAIDKQNKDLTAAFTIYKEAFNRNDSLKKESLHPLLKEGMLQLNTSAYYDWQEKKTGISGYALSNSIQAGNVYYNMVSSGQTELKDISPYVGPFRSATTDTAGAISLEAYNAGGTYNQPQRTVKAGTLQLRLPTAYEVTDFLVWNENFFSLELTPELSFSSDKPDCRLYNIKDTADKDASPTETARGGLYSLKNSSLKTSIQDVRESLLKEGARILAEDGNGVMYYYHQSCWVCRYHQQGNMHYVYMITLPDLSACAREFGRSAGMFQ